MSSSPISADVEARVKALKPAFLRWPGGNVAQDYHWTTSDYQARAL